MDCSCGHYYGIERPGSGGDDGKEEASSSCLMADDDCSIVSRFSVMTTATVTNNANARTWSTKGARTGATTLPTTLDASFVQLPPSFHESNHHHFGAAASLLSPNSSKNEIGPAAPASPTLDFLEKQQHLQFLEQVANSALLLEEGQEQPPLPPSLCVPCAERYVLKRSKRLHYLEVYFFLMLTFNLLSFLFLSRPLHNTLRVLLAMEADTERLENECRMYRQAMQDEDIRVNGLKRAIRSTLTSSSPSDEESSADEGKNEEDEQKQRDDTNRDIELAEAKFRIQLDALKESCRNQQAELDHVLDLRNEQAEIANDLDQVEWQVQEERNALELEAQAFDNEQEQLDRELTETLLEVDQLSSTAVRFPSVMLDLRVDDERGLRYPIINELRLAYRPKGDIQWAEIQAAWSLAAQLLLAIGSLLEFQSQHWKIVPLSHCAKLIYYPPPVQPSVHNSRGVSSGGCEKTHNVGRGIVHNLGHPKSNHAQAMVTWNALLHSMIEHARTKATKAREHGLFLDATTTNNTNPAAGSCGPMGEGGIPPELPFAMTANSIGGHRKWPDPNDDAGWSRVIHCMSCNLLWLSDLVSTLTLQEVLLSTCTVPSSALLSSR